MPHAETNARHLAEGGRSLALTRKRRIFGGREGPRRKAAGMARIAIVGPGAVGGVIAGWLSTTGRHELVLCARRPLSGLTVLSGEREIVVRATVWTNPAQARAVDWILVTTKAYDVAGAAAWLPALGASGAPVAVLQNGVEHRERFAPHVSGERIVPVMVDCPAERMEPTQVRQRGTARLAVADDTRGREFQGLFAGTPVEVALATDFKTVVWRKLCTNVAGVISALVLQPAGVMRDERVADLARALVCECIAVGRAEGAVLDDGVADAVAQGYAAAPPDSVNSLHADRAAGRPMEIDARNGVVVRLGRRHGIPTPLNEMAVTLLEAAARPLR